MIKKISMLFCIVFFSCKYEKSANTKSFINNNTLNKVTIIPYYQGSVVKEDSIQINPNELVLVLSKNEKGKGSGFSYPLYLAIYDSVLVVFDNSNLATHYSYATTNKGNNSKAIKYYSSRSIYNEANYIRKITQEDKRSISNEYTFTFSDQDYLDAKK